MQQSLFWKTNIPQEVKKLSTIYENLSFITTFIGDRHMSLSWTIYIQSIPSQPKSQTHFNIFHLRLGLSV
jgi:hypothetical protein